jgi:hypothetical protein
MRRLLIPLYRATCSSVYAADGKTPTGNFIHAVLAPYTYDGVPPCPFSTLIAVAPPTDDAGALVVAGAAEVGLLVVAGAAEVGLLVVAPPTSVTWFPAPERSIHRLLLLFQESAV